MASSTFNVSVNSTTSAYWQQVIAEFLERYRADQEKIKAASEISFSILCTVATLSFLANLTVFFTFLSMLKVHKSSTPNLMFLFQSLCDLVVTASTTLASIYLNLSSRPSRPFIAAFMFFFEYSTYISIVMLVFITCERFTAIQYPFHHRIHCTTTKLTTACVAVFILSSIPAVVRLTYIPSIYNGYLLKRQYYITTGIIHILLITDVYAMLFLSYRTINKSIEDRIELRQQVNNEVEATAAEKKKQTRIIIIVATMCTVYTVTFIPNIIITVYVAFTPSPTATDRILDYTLVTLYYFSSLINPIITLSYKDHYRKTLFKHFSRNVQEPTQGRNVTAASRI